MILKYFIFSIITSIFFALLEIQIEGKNGWAQKLPTWKVQPFWFKFIPGANKPLTGYHLYLWTFITLLAHTAFIYTPWHLKTELIIISFIIFILRLEDFLWYILNPNYGIKSFRPATVPWNQSWLGPLPTPYWYSLVAWLFFYYLGTR